MTDKKYILSELEDALADIGQAESRVRNALRGLEKNFDDPQWPEEWDDPSLDPSEPWVGPRKVNPSDVADAVAPADTFTFDPDATTWQTNRNVACPQCNNSSQKWSKNWMNLSANGKRMPAYRCGTAKWNPNERRFGGTCDWVAWRTDEEYKAAAI